jgi:hypothetical protein
MVGKKCCKLECISFCVSNVFLKNFKFVFLKLIFLIILNHFDMLM